MRRIQLQLLNPHPAPAKEHESMNHYDSHSERRARRRRNPSGAQAGAAAAHTVGQILAGAVATFVGRRVLGMKKADGTTHLSERQQLAAQAVVAVAAGIGGAMSDSKVLADVLDGTAIVMGGDAALRAAQTYNVEGQIRGVIPGMQPAATTQALPAPTTTPGGWVGMTNPYASIYS